MQTKAGAQLGCAIAEWKRAEWEGGPGVKLAGHV